MTMPGFGEHESAKKINMLIVGPSGAGKTGGVSSLIDAGLKIRALDFDNGLSPLRYSKKKDLLAKNVNYVTLKDNFKMTAGRVGIIKATAFQRGMDALDSGKGFGEGVGGISTWGSDTVLLLDTLALAAKSALFMVMLANARGMAAPHQSDYGTAMESIERLLDMITSDEVKCHVLVHTHTFVPDGQIVPLPEALGAKLPPKVGKFFDNMLSLSLTAGNRTYKTKKDGAFACKSAVPLKDTYPIETGLADIFRELLGKKPGEALA